MSDVMGDSDKIILKGAIELGEFMRTCLGPDGQRKLLVFDDKYVVTDDVHRVFDEIDLPHPGARLVAQHMVAQKEDIGDGSLTTLLLASAFAGEASALLEEGFLRATIERGFDRAGTVAVEGIASRARTVPDDDRRILEALARTALNTDRPELVAVVVEAATQIDAERRARNKGVDLEDLQFKMIVQPNTPPVELVRGVVIERDVVHEGMARQITNPRIAVIGGGKKSGSGIEERSLFRSGGNRGEGRTEVSFSPKTPKELSEFRDAEIHQVRDQVQRLANADVDAIFCTMGISDVGKRLLNDAGISAFRALTETDAAFLTRAIGSTVVMDIQAFVADAVGTAEELTVNTEADEPIVMITGCPEGRVATILISNPLSEYRKERERDLRTAVTVLLDAMDGEPLVPAGGGIEVALASDVRDVARKSADRTAVAMDAFADAFETIPWTLARNAGVDPLMVLAELRGRDGTGFDTDGDWVREAFPDGPLMTARVARTAVDTATHVATRLIRIDDLLEGREDDDWIPASEIDPQPVPERDFDY
jgi:chaperonin GroEL (HSP60 family)